MKTVKRRSQKQEKSVAKTFNARVTAASGALWGMKGDVRNDKFLIECKTTEKQFYSVTNKVWEKIREEAIQDHMRTPILVVDLLDRNRYVIFNPKDFETTLDPDMVTLVANTKEVKRSFRVYSWGDDFMEKCLLFSIKNTAGGVHDIVVWTEKNFLDYYKEELEC